MGGIKSSDSYSFALWMGGWSLVVDILILVPRPLYDIPSLTNRFVLSPPVIWGGVGNVSAVGYGYYYFQYFGINSGAHFRRRCYFDSGAGIAAPPTDVNTTVFKWQHYNNASLVSNDICRYRITALNLG